jgi:hypothetical protein
MAIRNSQELGSNLFLVAKRLLENNRLCRLLVNSNMNPLDIPINDSFSLLNKNIKVVPKIDESEFDQEGKLALVFPRGSLNDDNEEFKIVEMHILVYTTLDTWIINDENLRPFMIMSEIEKSLKNKRINGIGTMKYKGFDLSTLTDKLSCYQMVFYIDVFD